jgi:hypothetical protein
MKNILGFFLVVLAVIVMAGTGGGADTMPPDAGFVQWVSLACLALGALASGFVGVLLMLED